MYCGFASGLLPVASGFPAWPEVKLVAGNTRAYFYNGRYFGVRFS
jgi:hypothetical protein